MSGSHWMYVLQPEAVVTLVEQAANDIEAKR
jgi:hypothetical protein